MNQSLLKKYRLLITVFIVGLFMWFLIISPMITFHKNEAIFTNAAKRYFELNSDKFPVGERVRTLSLKELYDGSYIKEDFKAPYSGRVCSLDKSWVKVTKKNGEYKYYTFLDCGIIKSSIDHKGPTIKINGDEEIIINVGDKYKDPGVKSVVDNNDGKMKIEDVTVKSNVDSNKVGSYEVKYTSFDSLNNKSEVIRTVNVVRKLRETVTKNIKNEKYYKGSKPNNYIYFSNVLFRILKLDGDNVVLVSDGDVSNVDYDSIDKWFKYYDSTLTDSSKKLIVKNKYCNMNISEKDFGIKSCNSFGRKKDYGILSIDDINNTLVDGTSYLVGNTISWTINSKDNTNAYAFRKMFNGTDSIYYSFEKKHNFGVRPVITIKGDTLITDGDGSFSNPYVLTDFVKLEKNSHLNNRYIGEYVKYSNVLWIIQKIENDGTVKVICDRSLDNGSTRVKINYDESINKKIYDPSIKGNVGYKINNISSKYIDTSYFVNHTDTVPIYSDEPKYGGEIGNNKITAKIFSPNMYDVYSAEGTLPYVESFWLMNSSKSSNEVPGVSETGTVMYGGASTTYSYGIRPVAYFDKKVIITSGKGTRNKPFIIKK